MSLWGASDAVEDKPKHLTAAEKLNTYANELGWVKKTTGTGGRAGRVQEEVLVAIGDLSTSLNLADITAIDWNIDEFDKHVKAAFDNPHLNLNDDKTEFIQFVKNERQINSFDLRLRITTSFLVSSNTGLTLFT